MEGITYRTVRGEKEKQDDVMVRVYVYAQDIIKEPKTIIEINNNLLSLVLLLLKTDLSLTQYVLIIFPLPLFFPGTCQVFSLPHPISFVSH